MSIRTFRNKDCVPFAEKLLIRLVDQEIVFMGPTVLQEHRRTMRMNIKYSKFVSANKEINR